MKEIPHSPGCYLFKNDGKIIYVGKAKDLKKRVSSYFTKTPDDEKTRILVSLIEDVDFIATDTEVEALILENNLIKKHQPKYNINLKDSKRYAYLQITHEKFPRLLLARKKGRRGKFYGPFTSAEIRDTVRDILIKTFKLRTCKRFPKRPCLRFHIGLCDAPCVGRIAEDTYDAKMVLIDHILRGKAGNLLRQLDKDMNKASKRQNFELALERRDQINAIHWLEEKQKVERQKSYDEDVLNFIVAEDIVYLTLFNVAKGVLHNKQEFEFSYYDSFYEDFLLRYYSENQIPKELILPKEVDFSLHAVLETVKKSKIIITVPKIGSKKKLLELVEKNIELSQFGAVERLKSLQKELSLNFTPKVIECFDISHISGTSTTASMVQFRNGKPDRSNYRRFKIRTVDDSDDCKAIAEVVRRRYTRIKNEEKEFPNLIVIDGGKGQLSSALEELKKLELKIPIISIAKRFEYIYAPGEKQPIVLGKKSKALLLLQEIRNEAHRFAIKYNRLLRTKKILEDSK